MSAADDGAARCSSPAQTRMDRSTPRPASGRMPAFLGRKSPLPARKGFYLVSPFLGFFFFMITVGMASFYLTADQQALDTSKAGGTHSLVFTSYSLQADAFDVYFQNYLQSVIDNYSIISTGGETSGSALITTLQNEIAVALKRNLNMTYTKVYSEAFGIDCKMDETITSMIVVTFNNMRGITVLEWPPGSGTMWDDQFTPDQRTAAWPYISRYTLICTLREPPMTSRIDFTSRWYYLDAQCICCQVPSVCQMEGVAAQPFEACPTCLIRDRYR